MNCVYCGKQINHENKSKEHIIQNALGGLYESTKICCKECNNIVEQCIDKDFCSIFSPIITQIPNIKKTNKSSMPSCSGIAIYTEDNTIYDVIIKNKKVVDCKSFKQKYKRNMTKSDIDKFKIICYDFEVTNSQFINGICKIAFNYAIEKGIPFSVMSHILNVIKDREDVIKKITFNPQIIPFIPLNSFDSYLELETELELYHNLILFNFENYLICYVDLFNTFQFYVILSDSWEKQGVYEPYVQVIEKIDRKIPEYNINRTKHILMLSNIYNIAPTYEIDKLKKDIKSVIEKIPYEKEMGQYISNKFSWQYFLDKDGVIDKTSSMLFYMDENDTLYPKRFRISTPNIDEETGENKYYFYADFIRKLLDNGANYRDYTYRKFKRLTAFLNNIKFVN